MPSASRPNYSLSNGYAFIADVGKIGGELTILCCSTDITIEQTSESEDVICDPLVGIADRIDHTPRATVTMRELNFNQTILERALKLTTTYNTDGFRYVGNGNNPTTTPTALEQVDGPHAPTYATPTKALVQLNNAMIVSGSVVVWEMEADGSFTQVTATVEYADANTALATGEIYVTVAGEETPLYFTYKFQPMPVGSREMKNPWTLAGNSDVFLRVIHEHADGDKLFVFDFWRARVRPGSTINLKSLSGDRVIATDLVFDVFADGRYHSDSDLYAVSIVNKTAWEAITPLYGCNGGSLATPVA